MTCTPKFGFRRVAVKEGAKTRFMAGEGTVGCMCVYVCVCMCVGVCWGVCVDMVSTFVP